MAAHQVNVYLWLMNTIASGQMTLDDINRRWAHCRYNESGESKFPARKFFRYRNEIQELFDVEIACNRTTGKYYIVNQGDTIDDSSRKWLLNAMAVHSMLDQAKDLRDCILYEEIPIGTEYLSVIVEAIRDRKQIYMHYNTRYSNETHPVYLSPFCLKAFKQRWYVVGKPDNHPNEIRVYSLDRILDMQLTELPYVYPDDFSAEEFFGPYYGVFRNAEPTIIRVSVKELSAKYLRSLPLHPSQREIGGDENSLVTAQNDALQKRYIFEYYIAPTFDFVQELRTFGSDLKVLTPQSLVDFFRNETELMKRLYNGFETGS